jgi:hypothetical protein
MARFVERNRAAVFRVLGREMVVIVPQCSRRTWIVQEAGMAAAGPMDGFLDGRMTLLSSCSWRRECVRRIRSIHCRKLNSL